MKSRPCKIVDMSTSNTGKHGHAKVHLVGLDIFSGKKCEEVVPSTHEVDVPNVSRIEYKLVCFFIRPLTAKDYYTTGTNGILFRMELMMITNTFC